MNEDVFKGQWKEIRGKARELWGKLTDDDLETVNGRLEQMIGKLQARYGYSRDKAKSEIDMRLKEFNKRTSK